MSLVHSFPPIALPDARVLVLGTVPGVKSLEARHYYAHPRNLFWRLTGGALGFDPAAPYAERVAALKAARVALWDVLRDCERPGSLDGHIKSESAVPNDFASFLAGHASVRRVCFNGGKARELFERLVIPAQTLGQPLEYLTLPSTSPANAGIPYERKRLLWAEALTARLE